MQIQQKGVQLHGMLEFRYNSVAKLKNCLPDWKSLNDGSTLKTAPGPLSIDRLIAKFTSAPDSMKYRKLVIKTINFMQQKIDSETFEMRVLEERKAVVDKQIEESGENLPLQLQQILTENMNICALRYSITKRGREFAFEQHLQSL